MRQFLLSGLIALFIGYVLALNNRHSEDVSKMDPYIFEDLINQTIENIRQNISDPFSIDNVEITPNWDFLEGSLKISNFELAGLSGFQVTALNLAAIGMRFNFTVGFPSITLTTNYWADLVIGGDTPFYGEGKMNVDIDGTEIQGSTQVDLNDGIQIKNFRIQLNVNTITFDLHGILNDEEYSAILSKILSNSITQFIHENQELLTLVLSPILENVINGILNNGGTTTVTLTPSIP